MQLNFLISTLAIITSAVSAVALPPPSAGALVTRNGGSCNSVPQCCKSVHESNDKNIIQGMKVFGMDEKAAKKNEGKIATQCKPMKGILNIDLLNGCKSNAVCCKDNKFNGLIAVGCIPITIQL
ncbi:hypothetical protein AJ79_08359 [Helicocarpus griseus UAMH5409]|uniref:Hydrophobin n=1 Tax=Helicocarpus griseus UAMH5409 TaxID=1447875 RepID=A0A2B7WTK1_9EURO|nr:hypothetical protein AJ79_08359 [Helicocarpus griseus UAMH5409]